MGEIMLRVMEVPIWKLAVSVIGQTTQAQLDDLLSGLRAQERIDRVARCCFWSDIGGGRNRRLNLVRGRP